VGVRLEERVSAALDPLIRSVCASGNRKHELSMSASDMPWQAGRLQSRRILRFTKPPRGGGAEGSGNRTLQLKPSGLPRLSALNPYVSLPLAPRECTMRS
jgi:hypothetical protein